MAGKNKIPQEIDDAQNEFIRDALAYLDGDMNQEQVAAFDQLLAEDPIRRKLFVQFCYNARLISESLSDRIVSDTPDSVIQIPDQSIMLRLLEEAETSKQEAAERDARRKSELEREKAAARDRFRTHSRLLAKVGDGKIIRHYVIPKWAAYGTVVALFAIALVIFDTYRQPGGDKSGDGQTGGVSVPQAVVVATITETVGAQWEDASTVPVPGLELLAGEYEFTEGLVKLEFQDGAEMIVEAPSTLVLESAGGVRLLSGRVTGLCPPKARGFFVRTKWGRVVDLGTEFGVHASDKGMTDVEVFNGKVSLVVDGAIGSAANPMDINGGQAARLSDVGEVLSKHDANPFSFIRFSEFVHWVRAEAGSAYDRWYKLRYQLMRRNDVVAYFPFEPEHDEDNELRNLLSDSPVSNGQIHNARWVDGPLPNTHALRFDARDDHVRINIPGEYEQFTMAMWVNLESYNNVLNGLVMSDGAGLSENIGHWQISPAGDFQFASEPLPSAEAAQNHPLNRQTDTNRWMHLAVSYSRKTGIVYIYRDGQFLQRLRAKKFAALSMGPSSIGNWNPKDPRAPEGERQLEGDIAELIIFNAALPGGEIKEIYMAGNPNTDE